MGSLESTRNVEHGEELYMQFFTIINELLADNATPSGRQQFVFDHISQRVLYLKLPHSSVKSQDCQRRVSALYWLRPCIQ